MTAQVRYDKSGKQLPDTGHGCGCSLCENVGAPRYERRKYAEARGGGAWSSLRRELFRMVRSLVPGRAEAA